MLAEASAVLFNLETVGFVSLLTIGFDFWKKQRFARNLAKDISQKYKNYKGKTPGDCDRLLREKVESLCSVVRSNVNKQHNSGAISVDQSRRLVGRVDSLISKIRYSPRGRSWKAGWRLRRKLGKLDREVIDSLTAAIASSREGQAISLESCNNHLSSADEALTRRGLLVVNTG